MIDYRTGALAAPFPYFGGKAMAAHAVWAALGQVKTYVEPFCGSAAILLGAPKGDRVETINDFDGFVANFWRAVASDPAAVAEHADWPVNEADLTARHLWLVGRRESLTERLIEDPEWFDAKIAGWWVWGACCWIGSGWCSGDGPWVLEDGKLVKSGNSRGVHRKLPHLGDAGQGVHRQLPHLGDAGQGVHRQLPHLGSAGQGVHRKNASLEKWFKKLSKRLRRVRVACGDWRRVLGSSMLRQGLAGVFLDPPYEDGDMEYGAGGMGLGISKDVMQWCIENGANEKLRIVLCGHDGEHDELLQYGWSKRVSMGYRTGYAKGGDAKDRARQEVIWCSPFCVPEGFKESPAKPKKKAEKRVAQKEVTGMEWGGFNCHPLQMTLLEEDM